jgi:CheY-like chemotaxis protein
MSREKFPSPVVLVVDDEALIRWSLSEGLGDEGYSVRMAGSGAEAREELDAMVDAGVVVLLDLRLPDVSDMSLLQEIRAKRPDAQVIMMTAHGTRGGRGSRDGARCARLREQAVRRRRNGSPRGRHLAAARVPDLRLTG